MNYDLYDIIFYCVMCLVFLDAEDSGVPTITTEREQRRPRLGKFSGWQQRLTWPAALSACSDYLRGKPWKNPRRDLSSS